MTGSPQSVAMSAARRIRTAVTVLVAIAAALPVLSGRARAETGAIAAGKATYDRYCALCHGLGGSGGGPLAEALKATPPDLTMLAKRAGGTFPADRFTETVWTGRVPGHGKQVMLEWGKVLGGDLGQLEATATVLDLSIYVESLQVK